MKIRLERSLETWAAEAGYFYSDAIGSGLDLDYLPSAGTGRSLSQYGFSIDARISVASFYGQIIEHGLALAADLRVLCWYWPNGEEIIFPINTHGTVYIGNSPEFWFDFYPFLRRMTPDLWEYQCVLPINPVPIASITSGSNVPLYVGGQTHFGHFIADTFSPLLTLAENMATQPIGPLIVPPGHSGVTKELLDLICENLVPSCNPADEPKPQRYLELPSVNGIFTIGEAYVPAKNHRPDSEYVANSWLTRLFDSSHTNMHLQKSHNSDLSIAYVSRYDASSEEHDRISNWSDFKLVLAELGIDHLCPTTLDLAGRINLLSRYQVFISDSGSCGINPLLFGSPESLVFILQSPRMLSDPGLIACSQHYQGIASLSTRRFSIIGETIQNSASNSWYDRVHYSPTVIRQSLGMASSILKSKMYRC